MSHNRSISLRFAAVFNHVSEKGDLIMFGTRVLRYLTASIATGVLCLGYAGPTPAQMTAAQDQDAAC